MRRTRFPAPATNPPDDRNRSAGKGHRSLRTSLPVDERHPTLDAFLNGNDGNENISLVTLNPPLSVSPKDGVVSQLVVMIRVENDEHAAISACSPSLATRPPTGPLPGREVASWKFR